MGNDSTVFVMVVPSEPFRLFWAEDQATLISYGVQNRWKEQRDYRIVSMLRSNFEDIELPAGSYTDEVWEYKEGFWITESEQEILESNLDYEMDSLIHHLESARKILKVMTGDGCERLNVKPLTVYCLTQRYLKVYLKTIQKKSWMISLSILS